ncbi:hypothetical protein ACN28E_23020 [Archangium lansingense]|uniref:hypothetical protein n=1 Tax=Archangium lansingense TaxID=2995310 RepID=UPI003B80FEC7
MINTYRVTVLFALLATSSTVAWAETSVSPVPLIVAKEGSVVYVGKDGPRILADCRQNSDSRMLGGPERGKIVRKSKPCSFTSLAVHPPTGRWAVAAHVTGDSDIPHSLLVSFVVAGRELNVPKNKAGRAKGGNFLVLGDLNGIVAITSGLSETWTEDGRFFPQFPEMFTADGSRVLVSIGDSSMVEWWSWSFGPRPESVRVLPRGTTDTAGNMLLSGEQRTVLRHPRGGVRVATLESTGKRPWKVGPPLKQVRKGMLTPVVLGDTMLFFREGDNSTDCEGVDAGSYRRLELSTGQERVWRRYEGQCSTHDSFAAASPLRRTLYFLEGVEHYSVVHLYEYDVRARRDPRDSD